MRGIEINGECKKEIERRIYEDLKERLNMGTCNNYVVYYKRLEIDNKGIGITEVTMFIDKQSVNAKIGFNCLIKDQELMDIEVNSVEEIKQ